METKKIILNSVCTGVVATFATKLLLGEYGDVEYFGINMSAPVANGLGCGVGSIVSDVASDMVIKKLNISNQIMNGSTMAVKAGIGGGASAGVLYFGGMPSTSIPTAFLVGAGSKLGGDYLNEKVFDSRTGFIPLF